jgi:Fe-S cluster assembly scaffold protein SufB
MTVVGRSHRAAVAPGWASEYEDILSAYGQAGGDPDVLRTAGVAILVVSANRVLAANEVPGLRFEAEEMVSGVRARVTVEPAARLARPVHLCFGMLPGEGLQQIDVTYAVGADAAVEFLAHCTFPNAVDLRHEMRARVHLAGGAAMTYREAHYHGEHGGIVVAPTTRIVLERGARYVGAFGLLQGRVGSLEIDTDVDGGEESLAELTVRAYGTADDRLRVEETVRLNGRGARGLTKTRIAVRDRAISEVVTTTEGNAPDARGHMDCTEVVRGRATASNMPRVVVHDEHAHVTHEAAIGAVNRKELETLMARGLDEDAAVDVIIRGMLQ